MDQENLNSQKEELQLLKEIYKEINQLKELEHFFNLIKENINKTQEISINEKTNSPPIPIMNQAQHAIDITEKKLELINTALIKSNEFQKKWENPEDLIFIKNKLLSFRF